MLRIKNKYTVKVFVLLRDLSLSLKESRLRSKFCKILAQHNDEVYMYNRQEIIDLFAVLDENNQFIVPENKKKEYLTEIKMLEDEELLIECNELNKTMILCVNDILNNEQVFDKLSGEDALIHDMLCDIFEDAASKYN